MGSEAPKSGVSRRTLVAGVAWATPAVALASAAPAVAASLPPCVSSVTNTSLNWVVDGAAFTGCGTYACHRDVRLEFAITSCASAVQVRVQPVAGKATWCYISGYTGTSVMTKTVPANTGPVNLEFPATGDSIDGCSIIAHTNSAVNDGIHVNGCQSNQIKYWIKVGAAAETGPYFYNTPAPTCG